MRNRITDMFGIEYPIFAFSHCRDVVIEVSRAGGLGVLGAVMFTDDDLERELSIIDRELNGLPYGVDVLVPATGLSKTTQRDSSESGRIPEEHRRFVESVLDSLAAPRLRGGEDGVGPTYPRPKPGAEAGTRQAEIAMEHPISILASALGSPARAIVDSAHDRGIKVAALAGKVTHALRHVEDGIDVIVAQGYEAAGHTGEIASMVLIPDVVDAVTPIPVLAAGGIGTGRQIAAARALGAEGVWMGSIWLTSLESDALDFELAAYERAKAEDTVRSRIRSGIPVRMLRSKWTEAWESPGAPMPLPLGLQSELVAEAHERLRKLGDVDATPGLPVGQIVGRMGGRKSCRELIFELVDDYVNAVARLNTADLE